MFQEKKLTIIKAPNCKGNTDVFAFYNKTDKKFLIRDDENRTIFREISLGNYFEEQISSNGTGSRFFQALLNLPEFKKLWAELSKSLTPIFQTGEQTVRYKDWTPEIYTVGAVNGWYKVCDRISGYPELKCKRTFINTKTNSAETRFEDDFMPVSELQKCAEAREIINEVGKKFKKEGLVGGILIHLSKAYRF